MRTSCSVDSLAGPSCGITWNANTVPSSETPTGATATTSLCSARTAATSTCVRSWSASATASGVCATTSSGPFCPAPNCSATV
ncbi:hypothetical protein [Microbacterium aurum]